MPGGSRTTPMATVTATLVRIEAYVDELESGHQVFGIFGPRAPPLGEPLGDPYFVDGSVTSSGDGTGWATAVKTIAEGPGLCTANQNDVIFVKYVSPSGYDENANTGGVIVDKDHIHIIGLGGNQVRVVNSHVAATAVFTVNAGIRACEIAGFYITEATDTVEGIWSQGSYLSVHDCIFIGSMENAIHLSGADFCQIYDNIIIDPINDGIEITGTAIYNLITNCHFLGITDNAINLNGANVKYNYIIDNTIQGMATTTTGINITLGQYNTLSGGFIGGCTTAILDSGLFNIWDVPVDVVRKGSFNRTVANALTEITTDIDAIDLPSSGDYEIVFDLNTLVIAAEGGTFTMRLYQLIGDVTGRIVDLSTFLVGTDVVHPSVSHSFEGGPSRMRVTHQVSVAVTGNRSIPYKIIQKR